MMTEIVPKLLWIGGVGEVRQISKVLEAGIEAIVDLALEERPPSVTRDLVYCRFPLVDGGGNSPGRLLAAVEAVVSLLENRLPTLVYCGAGMSRSPAIVAAALAGYRGSSLDDSLLAVVSGRAHDVSPGLWSQVKSLTFRGSSQEPGRQTGAPGSQRRGES